MNIFTGKWKGYYLFGLGYAPPYFGKKVKFEIEFEGSNDDFKGICREEKTEYSLHDDSEIYGFIEDGFISFVKTYKTILKEKNEGAMHSRVAEKNEVKYIGAFNEETKSIYGSWEIENEFMENGELINDDVEGLWEIWREGE